MAQSKVELLIETPINRLRNNLSRAKRAVSGAVQDMRKELSSFKDHSVKAFSAMKEEVPGLGRAVELLTNPYVLATAAVLALGAAMGSAVTKAGDFNNTFLDIRQLNLDKSEQALDSYRQKVLDAAFDVGLNAKATATAFYDVQSGLGIFGNDVDTIVRKVGQFSIATRSELPDNINSTIKAFKAFGLTANDLDAFLASNAKTVQVGITTFGQLAQVQTEYAGAAASAGQSVDTANKIFAAFTSVAKDSNIAANMTKTAFQGLTQKSTVDGLKAIGVNMFDAKGNIQGIDSVIGQLVPKIAAMSDSDFATFRNSIGGPEGLQALFNQLRTQGDQVLTTFKAFDDSAFDLSAAIKNANGDFNILKDIVGERLNTVMIELGTTILPIVAYALEGVNGAITYIRENATFLSSVIQALAAGFLVLKLPMIATFAAAAIGSAAATISTWTWVGALAAVRTAIFNIPIVGWIAAAIAGLILLYQNFDSFKQMLAGIGNVFKEMMPIFESVGIMLKGISSGNWKMVITGKEMLDKAWNEFDIKGAYKRGYDAAAPEDTPAADAPLDPLTGQPVSDAGITSTGTGISPVGGKDGPSQVRNITVNIDALNKGGINVSNQNTNISQMSPSQLEQWFNDMMLRTIRNVETSAG